MSKYDEISCRILEYFENHIMLSKAELEDLEKKNRNNPNKVANKKTKEQYKCVKKSDDLCFGMWANVEAKLTNKKIVFEKTIEGVVEKKSTYSSEKKEEAKPVPEHENSVVYATSLPFSQKNAKIILRYLWTSFDFISGRENQKKSNDLCIGGVICNRMYIYPESCKGMLKWTMRQVLSQ